MNTSRRTCIALAAPLAAAALLLAGCSSDSSKDSSATTPTATADASAANSAGSAETACPTGTPTADAVPQYVFHGTTGSAAVTGSTATDAPKVTVTTPFVVAQTEVHTLTPGDGPVVAEHANVNVCYAGYSGSTGKVFDQTPYTSGQGTSFGLDQVVPGFSKAIAGQKVGSTVAVAIAGADGYGAAGQPAAGIAPNDTLVFAIKVLSAQ